MVNEVQSLNIPPPLVKLANVILLGNVVSEAQALNIESPLVTFANVMLFGIFVILLPLNI